MSSPSTPTVVRHRNAAAIELSAAAALGDAASRALAKAIAYHQAGKASQWNAADGAAGTRCEQPVHQCR